MSEELQGGPEQRVEQCEGSVACDPSSCDIREKYRKIYGLISRYCEEFGRKESEIELIVVSKLKPVEDILCIYEEFNHKHFGENYVQEICSKSPHLPSDIMIHFIGHLQANKVTKLINEVPQLYMIETIDSIELAKKVNDGNNKNTTSLKICNPCI